MRSAELVRQGRFDEVDRESLAEELEDMEKSERRELIGPSDNPSPTPSNIVSFRPLSR